MLGEEKRSGRHSQIGYRLKSGLLSTKANWINISNVHSGKSLREKKSLFNLNNLIPSGSSVTESVNAMSFHLPYSSLLDRWDASFMRGGWGGCLDCFWHWDICSVPCVLCAWWIGGRIGVDGSWIGGKKAIGCRPLGQSLKAAKCHRFTVAGIARGNRDYRGREISRVLANRNLVSQGDVSKSFICSVWVNC